MHSISKREYWIKHACYQVKCRGNIGLTSIPMTPILKIYQLQITSKSFNPLLKDKTRMNLRATLEMLMKGNAKVGTACICLMV